MLRRVFLIIKSEYFMTHMHEFIQSLSRTNMLFSFGKEWPQFFSNLGNLLKINIKNCPVLGKLLSVWRMISDWWNIFLNWWFQLKLPFTNTFDLCGLKDFQWKWNIWNLETNNNLLWGENQKECEIEYCSTVSCLKFSSLDVKKVWNKYSFMQYLYGFTKFCA